MREVAFELKMKKINDSFQKTYTSHELFSIVLPFYEPVIKYYTKRFFALGSDNDDIYQQGLIGLYKAVLAYDPRRNEKFDILAKRCIKVSILNLVRADNAKKRLIHYSCYSLDNKIGLEDQGQTYYDILPSMNFQPLDLVIDKESTAELETKLSIVLSELERKVLLYYLDGMDYNKIALAISVSTKTVDNALQRIKRKILKSS